MIAHNVFLAFLVSFLIAAVLSCIFDCTPFANFSVVQAGKLAHPQKCDNLDKLNISLAAIHIATDFTLLSVPLIVLYKMQMSTTKKLRLGFLFSVGSFSCIGSVMRNVVESQADPDITWASRNIYQWVTVDIFFAIIAASLPVLNAAVPKGWRKPNSINPLRNLSLLEKSHHSNHPRSETGEGRIEMEAGKISFGRDGTVMDVEKGLFHKKMQKRWDDAYATRSVKQPQPVWALRRPALTEEEEISSEGRGRSESGSSEGSAFTSNGMRDEGPSDTSNSIPEQR